MFRQMTQFERRVSWCLVVLGLLYGMMLPGWVIAHWQSTGDWRFVAISLILLGLTAGGIVSAFLPRAHGSGSRAAARIVLVVSLALLPVGTVIAALGISAMGNTGEGDKVAEGLQAPRSGD